MSVFMVYLQKHFMQENYRTINTLSSYQYQSFNNQSTVFFKHMFHQGAKNLFKTLTTGCPWLLINRSGRLIQET